MEEENKNLEQESQIEQDYNPVPHEELHTSNNKKFVKISGVVILLIILGFIFYPKISGGVMCGPLCPPTGLSTYEKSCLGIKIRDTYIDGHRDLCFGIVYGEKMCYGREHLSDSRTTKLLSCDYPAYNQEIHLKQNVKEDKKVEVEEERWKTYINEKYNFSFKYDSYKRDSSLEVIIQDEDNVIWALNPLRDKYQDEIECDDTFDSCVIINDKKYVKSSNKITVIDFIHNNNIEQTVNSFLKKNGFDFKNCQLIIEDYEYGKKATLKLSEEMAINEEDIKKWEEEHGPEEGAYLNKQLASVEKTKKYCSEFADSDMPEIRYFIFKENREDIFLFYELDWAQENGAFLSDSIKFLEEDKVYIKEDNVYYYNSTEDTTILVTESIKYDIEDSKFYDNKTYKKATLSPNGEFILLEGTGFEWFITEVYDISSKTTYTVNENGYIIWLNDNRIKVEGGCGMGTPCGIFESINSEEPWILEKISD